MIEVVLVGIGGYGEDYLTQMLENAEAHCARLVGCVDPFASSSRKVEDLRLLGIPIYDDLSEFYKNHSADLAIISSPIHHHKPQVIIALNAGSNVLCEKPIAALVEDALEMADAAEKANRFVAIGYQWSFSPANLALKEDILSGAYGKPLRFKTYTCWPRYESYYRRNNWAGCIKTDKGQWVLDSPVQNATAHYLHNMLFMAGSALNKSVSPEKMQVGLYRAKEYENYDTAAMRIITDSDVEILFLTTHSCQKLIGPVIELDFERGKVMFSNGDSQFVGHTADGVKKNYGNSFPEDMRKLWVCIDAIRDKDVITCDINTALSHLVCVNIAQRTLIYDLPQSIIKTACNDGDGLTYIEGIEDIFVKCFEASLLPSELSDTHPICAFETKTSERIKAFQN